MTMTKEDAIRELNRLCDSAGEFVPVQEGEFTSIEFAESRHCGRRTANRILVDFEKQGAVSRRRAAGHNGAIVVWRFTEAYLSKLKETPLHDQSQAPSPQTV